MVKVTYLQLRVMSYGLVTLSLLLLGYVLHMVVGPGVFTLLLHYALSSTSFSETLHSLMLFSTTFSHLTLGLALPDQISYVKLQDQLPTFYKYIRLLQCTSSALQPLATPSRRGQTRAEAVNLSSDTAAVACA